MVPSISADDIRNITGLSFDGDPDAKRDFIIGFLGSSEEVSLDGDEVQDAVETVVSIRRDLSGDWRPPQPSSDADIWRYLNFTQLQSILERKKMWFSNINQFEDPYEGTIPQPNVEEEIQEIVDKADVSRDLAQTLHSIFYSSAEEYVQSGYVNCWNLSEYESAALWEQYLDSSQGVAIRTTVDDLKKAIEDSNEDREFRFGKVEYKDYERETIPRGRIPPMYHKRNSFQHENEFRVSFITEGDETLGSGVYMDIDIETLLDRIYLAPTSKKWFKKLVEEVLDTYNVDCELKKSDVYSDPVY